MEVTPVRGSLLSIRRQTDYGSVRGSPNGSIGNFTNGAICSQLAHQWYHWLTNRTMNDIGIPFGTIGRTMNACRLHDIACVHGSTNGIPISFKVLPMVPLVIPPLVKTVGSQYCRQCTVWAKLPMLESHMIQYGVLNFKFINFTNKHCFYQDTISK